nr:VOC family protein [Pseudoxanthomonas sp.]
MQLLINLDVPDLEAAETLYKRAFGLTTGRRLGGDVVELLGAQAPLYLLRNAAGSEGAPHSPRRYDRHWTPVHLDVVVEDLDAALAIATQAGLRAETPIREARWGRIVRLADPFGHGWCLLQFSGRGYDEITT